MILRRTNFRSGARLVYSFAAVALCAICAICVWPLAATHAQDPFAPMGGGAAPPDPFAPMPTAPAAGNPFGPPAAGAGNPFGGAAPAPALPAAPAAAEAATVKESLANRVLAQNPESVDDLMRAVRDLSNLGDAQRVKDMVVKLQAAGLDENQLADLEQRWGAGLFTRLALEPPYAPEAQKFAQSVLDAARARRTAAARLSALLDDAIGDDAAKRRIAIRELRAAGEATYPTIVTYLRDPSRSDDHSRLIAAVARLGEIVDPAMAAAIDSDDELLQTNAAGVLGLRKQREGLTRLLHYGLAPGVSEKLQSSAQDALQTALGGMPAKTEAVSYLSNRAKEFASGGALGVGNLEGQVVLWRWNAEKSAIESEFWLTRDAAVLAEARVIEALYAIAPDNADHLRMRLTMGLAAEKLRGGIDQPLPNASAWELAERAGAEKVVEVLAESMHAARPLAAVGAAEALGRLGDPTVLFRQGRPAVLCEALNADSPRVRFAALDAIMQMAPSEPFWGSSVAMERITQAVTAAGANRVLVAHPETVKGQTWAGLLAESGIPADAVQTGKEVAAQAVRHIDYQVILLSSRVQKPLLRETIQRIREQPVCRQMPIGIICPGDDLFEFQDLAIDFERVQAFPEPYDGARISSIYARLMDEYPLPPTRPALRIQQSRKALGWLAQLADNRGRYAYFDIERAQAAAIATLPLQESSAEAARVLGKIGNRQCQMALVDLASIATLPVDMRRAAVAAFKEAVSRRGLMLYSKEVNQQYDRYNQSAALPKSTQQLLGEVLDIIESTIPRSAPDSRPNQGQTSATGG